MSIYTKTGDKGTTLLIGGKRVNKYNDRIEAYGTVDELMANIGMVYDLMVRKEDKDLLLSIQNSLMACASILATDCVTCEFDLPVIEKEDILVLEKAIDNITEEIPPLKKFIIPGGHVLISACHIARTVCRRAERLSVIVAEKDKKSEIVVKYLNRLSDFLFVLSRKIAHELKIQEITWDIRS